MNIQKKLIQKGLNIEAEKLEILQARQSSLTFKIPVMGGMKSGKSTLLAKMFNVNEEYFPKDMVEATAKNIYVSYGPFAMRSYATIDGIETSVGSAAQWRQLVCGHSDLKFKSLNIHLCDPLLDNGAVTFVDSPGNNTCDNNKATETWDALVDSQTGIYCLKATALMENSDLTFLQEAKYYVNDFIFVITRIDEAGGKSVKSDIANQLVLAAKKKLEEFQIHPLAILPICALTTKLEDSGIPELKVCIENIVKKQGEDLRNHQIFRQGTRILEDAKINLNNALKISQKALTTTKEQFAEQRGLLQSKLVDLNSEMSNSIRRLEKKIEMLKNNSEKKVFHFSEETIKCIESRLDEIKTYTQIKELGDSVVRSEIDKWRQNVQNYLVQLPEEISAMQVEASQDFVTQLHDSVMTTMDLNLQIQVADIDEDFSAKTYAEEYLADISRQRDELIGEIETLRQEINESGEKNPELERKLVEAKEALQSLHYEPVYDQIECKKEGGVTPILKTIGSIADIAMIFLPTGWITSIGKVGVASSKLPKIAKIVKTGSMISGAGKVIPNMPGKKGKKGRNPLECLSFEFWGEKIGNMIDSQNNNPRYDLVENQEVLGDYLRKKSKMEAIYNQAKSDYIHFENKINEKQRTLEFLKQQSKELSIEYQKVEEEVRDIQKKMRESLGQKELIQWKINVLAKVNSLLYVSQSELIQPIIMALENYFSDCLFTSKKDLQERLSATIRQVEEQLSEKNLVFSQEKMEVEKNLTSIKEQIQCLEDILGMSENLWFTP